MNEPSTQPHRACFLDGFTHLIRYKAMPGSEVAAWEHNVMTSEI